MPLGHLGLKAPKIEAKLVFVCQAQILGQTNVLIAIWVPLGHMGPKAPKIEAKSMFVCQVQVLGKLTF